MQILNLVGIIVATCGSIQLGIGIFLMFYK